MTDQHHAVDAKPEAKGGSFGIGTIARGVRRHLLLTFLVLVAMASVSAGIWLFLPLPKLTAYAIFQISSQPQTLFTPVGDAKADFNYYRQGQAARVKSRPILNAALNEPDVAKVGLLQDHQDAIGWLESVLQVDFKSSPELMRLSLEGDRHDDMLKIIEAITVAYMKEVADKDKTYRKAKFEQLKTVYSDYQVELKKYRTKINDVAEALGSSVPESLALKEKNLQEHLSAAQREQVQVQSQMRRLTAEAHNTDNKLKSADLLTVPVEQVDAEIRRAPEYQKLLARRDVLQDLINETKAGLTPGARPAGLVQREEQLTQINKELDGFIERMRPGASTRVKESLLGEGKRSLAGTQDQLVVLKEIKDQIDKEITDLTEQLRKMNAGQLELEAIRQEISQTEKTADRVRQDLEAIRPELESAARVSIAEKPTVVSGIEGNRRLKYTLMAGGAVLLLGLGLITFLEARNRRIVTAKEVSDDLGMTVIGTVPSMPGGAGPNGAAEKGKTVQWQSMFTECVDATRTMLVHSVAGAKPGLTLLVASAMPGEGKTMLACQLAASLARGGYRTLLVDGDMRRPNIHRVLGLPSAPGMCDLLRGEASPADAIRPAVAPGLSFLPAGAWDLRVSQTLSTDRWRVLKEQMEGEYDYVIIDSSPVLLVTDPLLLARGSDGVVMSILRNISQTDAVAEARNRFAAVGVKVYGAVIHGLNGPTPRVAYPYYGAAAPAENAMPAAVD